MSTKFPTKIATKDQLRLNTDQPGAGKIMKSTMTTTITVRTSEITPSTTGGRWKVWAVLMTLLGLLLLNAGCCSSSGSRDFVPGKGWVPND